MISYARGMCRRRWLSVPISAVLLLAWPAASYASVGVGVQAGPVRLHGAAHPGGTYTLPSVYVVNTGTQPESVALTIERISPGTGRTVPAAWVSVSSAPVRLSHGQAARIPLSLSVPRTAKPGRYFSDVVAKGSGTLSAGAANLGVAAATDLEFTVARGVVAAAGGSVPGWVLSFLLAITVALIAAALIRRSGIRIRIEREPLPGRGRPES